MQKLFIILATLFAITLPQMTQAIDIEGPYVSLMSGFNFLHYNDKHLERDFKLGWNVGLNAGYRFCNGFRAEGEVNYRYNRIRTEKPKGKTCPHVGGKLFTWSFMANGLYEIPTCFCNITPYLGAGLGYDALEKEVIRRVIIEENPGFKKVGHNTRDKGIAWQAIAGALYQIDDGLELGLQYTFHRIINNRYLNNTIDLRLNWFY